MKPNILKYFLNYFKNTKKNFLLKYDKNLFVSLKLYYQCVEQMSFQKIKILNTVKNPFYFLKNKSLR